MPRSALTKYHHFADKAERAERRAGQLLAEMEKANPGRKPPIGAAEEPIAPTLDTANLDRVFPCTRFFPFF